MRRGARVDQNQKELMDAWRELGGTVLYLHMLGGGAPDTLLGLAGQSELVEIKTPKGELNEKQIEWRRLWRGRPPREVRTLEELIALAEQMRARRSTITHGQ
jgi:hypothetical protein